MENKQILKSIIVVALLAVGCGSTKTSSNKTSSVATSSKQVSSISQVASSYQSSSSTTSASSSASSSSSSSTYSTSSSSTNTADPYAYFERALQKDYTNLTAGVTQIYNEGMSEEFQIEYYYNEYQIVYETYLAESGYDPYLYYHDYQGDNYLYFSPDSINPEGAWLNKGYKDADLSIENTYFSMNQFLNNVTKDDVIYQNGFFFIKDEKLDLLNRTLFRFAYENNPEVVGISLNEDGYIYSIVGVDPYTYEPTDGVIIELEDIGSTHFDNSKLPPKPNEDNVKEYWEYKGEDGPYVDIYPESITLTLDEGVASDESYDVIIDIEKSVEFAYKFLPENTNVKDIEFHSTNEDVAVVSSSWTSGKRSILGVKDGTCKIYATSKDETGKVIKSNEISVKVKPLQAQNKENCVFDLTFDSQIENTLYTTNHVENEIPYEVTTHKGNLRDGTYAGGEAFTSNEAVVVLNPSDSKVMDTKDYVRFDLGTQQVSSISLYYAMFYSSGFNGLSKISKAAIRYSNDGVNYSEVDVLEQITSNISLDNKKLLEVEFAPSSIVEIYFESTTIGSSFSFGFSSVALMKNELCNDYQDNTNVVEVESVVLTTLIEERTLEVGKKMNFTATVLPSNATNKNVTFVSTNPEVASISTSGVLTALSAGTVEVYAVSDNQIESNRIAIEIKAKTVLPQTLLNTTWIGEDDSYNACQIKVLSNTQIQVNFQEESHLLDIDGMDGSYYNFVNEDSCLGIKENFSYDNKLDIQGNVGIHYFNRYSSNITFDKLIELQSITLTMERTTLIVGETLPLRISFNPKNATNQEVTLSGYDSSIISIDEYNYVTALSAGTTTITATGANNVTATLEVTISPKIMPEGISLSTSKDTILVGETTQINVSFTNEDTNQTNLTFRSKNPSIAKVNSSGLVTGLSQGDAVIEVETVNGLKETITIHVTAPSSTLPSELIGTFVSEDGMISITIDSDGNLYMIAYDAFEYYLSLSDVSGNTYTFTNDDGDEVIITLDGESITVTVVDNSQGVLYIEDSTSFEKQ